MSRPDEKEHPTKTDHPGKGKGDNPNPGNRPDRPVEPDPDAPHPDQTLPGDLPEDPPVPTQLPA